MAFHKDTYEDLKGPVVDLGQLKPISGLKCNVRGVVVSVGPMYGNDRERKLTIQVSRTSLSSPSVSFLLFVLTIHHHHHRMASPRWTFSSMMITPSSPTTSRTRRSPLRGQRSKCVGKLAACSLQLAACSMQHAACSMQHLKISSFRAGSILEASYGSSVATRAMSGKADLKSGSIRKLRRNPHSCLKLDCSSTPLDLQNLQTMAESIKTLVPFLGVGAITYSRGRLQVQCAVCSVQREVCSMHCAVCSVQCAVCSVQCEACIVHRLTFVCPRWTLESCMSTTSSSWTTPFGQVFLRTGVCGETLEVNPVVCLNSVDLFKWEQGSKTKFISVHNRQLQDIFIKGVWFPDMIISEILMRIVGIRSQDYAHQYLGNYHIREQNTFYKNVLQLPVLHIVKI